MKKIEYLAPEMEEVKLNIQNTLLAGSGEEAGISDEEAGEDEDPV